MSADKPGKKAPDNQISATLDLVKRYAVQETVGPLRNAKRFLALGAAGSVALAVGVFMLSLGMLRFLQAETSFFNERGGSVVAYLITLLFSAAVLAFTVWRIRAGTIEREGK